MESPCAPESQLWLAFMYWEQPTAERRAARTRAEVAKLMKLTPEKIESIERSAFRKLRRNPEVKRLMRYFSQQNSCNPCHSIEPAVMRRAGTLPQDASYLTTSIYRKEY